MLVESEGGLGSSIWLNFLTYLAAVIISYVAQIASSFIAVGLAYQYGHASERLDAVAVVSDIDNFEKLK